MDTAPISHCEMYLHPLDESAATLRLASFFFFFYCFCFITQGFDCTLNTGKNDRLQRKSKAKRFLTTSSVLEKKKKKRGEEKKQRRGPAVCIYIYTALTTMNKTPASQALLGQFR